MTVYKLGLPSELRRRLANALPSSGERRTVHLLPVVLVTPRDRRERKCPAYDADHYEVHAFYTTADPAALLLLELALQQWPGVYLTTRAERVSASPPAVRFTNEAWPHVLGNGRRDRNGLRPQVMALIKDTTGG